jgi:hypothetical protein
MATLLAAILVLSSPVSGGAPAQERLIAANGCAVLSRAVRTELLRHGLNDAHGTAVRAGADGQVDIRTCDQTARTASAAFASAFERMKIYVGWNPDPGRNDGYCLGGDLTRCSPDRNALMPENGLWNPVFVNDAWRAVRQAIIPTLRFGTDVSRFDELALRLALRRSIARQSSRAWLHSHRRKDRHCPADRPD